MLAARQLAILAEPESPKAPRLGHEALEVVMGTLPSTLTDVLIVHLQDIRRKRVETTTRDTSLPLRGVHPSLAPGR